VALRALSLDDVFAGTVRQRERLTTALPTGLRENGTGEHKEREGYGCDWEKKRFRHVSSDVRLKPDTTYET
jgi:hypothetical protein